MINMSYCAMENTFLALREAQNLMSEAAEADLYTQEERDENEMHTMSESERDYMIRLVRLCREVADDWQEVLDAE